METKMNEIIRQLRKSKSMTQSEIAQRLGVTQQAYQCYESGRRQPSIETLILIADIYGVSLDYLVGRYK